MSTSRSVAIAAAIQSIDITHYPHYPYAYMPQAASRREWRPYLALARLKMSPSSHQVHLSSTLPNLTEAYGRPFAKDQRVWYSIRRSWLTHGRRYQVNIDATEQTISSYVSTREPASVNCWSVTSPFSAAYDQLALFLVALALNPAIILV